MENPYYEIIQEDGITASGLTIRIKETDYEAFQYCIFPEETGLEWSNRIENARVKYSDLQKNNFMYNFPFVDKGKKYIVYVVFTKNGVDFNPYPTEITVTALSGIGQSYFTKKRIPKVNINSNGDIVISDVPDVPNLSNITNSYYYLYVYKEGNLSDNLTLIYNLSSVKNNIFSTNITEKLQAKGWIAKDCLFNFGYDFWYNSHKYSLPFIDNYEMK